MIVVAGARRRSAPGTACRPSTTALMMNGRYVSFCPVCCLELGAHASARMRATRVKSTSKNERDVRRRCAATATMCSLMSARIFDIGSTRSPGHGSGSGPCVHARPPRRVHRAAASPAAALGARLEEVDEVPLRHAAGDAAALHARRSRRRARRRSCARAATTWCEGAPRTSCRRCAADVGRGATDGGEAGGSGAQLALWGGPPRRRRRRRDRTPLAAAGAGAAAGAAIGRALLRLERATTVCTATVWPSVDEDLGEHAGRRRRNLGVDLVGRDLEDRLVALHLDRRPSSATSTASPRRSIRPSGA